METQMATILPRSDDEEEYKKFARNMASQVVSLGISQKSDLKKVMTPDIDVLGDILKEDWGESSCP